MLTRRALVTRSALTGAAIVFLWPSRADADAASRADADAAGRADAGSGSSQAGTDAESAKPVLALTKNIRVGGGRIIKGKYVITQPKKNVFRCFSAKCTHQGCTLASVSRGTINCPCHGSKFNISTGAVVQGPAKRALPRKKIKVAGGKIRLA
ncbi:Rieske (2Fe-2S) protein [Nonomuraea endophytica]|uniref:Rieske (2Fe-2S) protein n=1 Tax=Nonomuraea endophytica TaxID=714136 RepID=UPI0037CC005E